MQKKNFIYRLTMLLFFLLFCNSSSLLAQRNYIGFSAHGNYGMLGNGFVFEGDKPHSTLGGGLGIHLFIPRYNNQFILIGLQGNYQNYHFHTEDDANLSHTEYYHNTFLQIPISYNKKFLITKKEKAMEMKYFLGAAINSSNFLSAHKSTLNNTDIPTQTQVEHSFFITPELFLGIGFVYHLPRLGYLHYNVSVHSNPFKSNIFTASVGNNNASIELYNQQKLRESKMVFSIIFFPESQLKKFKNDSKWSECN